MKQVLFLYNPQSGKGKIEKDSQAIGEMFRQAGYSRIINHGMQARSISAATLSMDTKRSIWWSWRAATARSITWSIG